jgi:hypothetical protein
MRYISLISYLLSPISYHLSLITALIFITTLVSCQKEVHINLGTASSHVVVQGAIETGYPPYVILTSTVSFFSQVDLTTLQNSFIHNATVKVTGGGKTIMLKEYSIDTGINNKVYVWSVDTTNLVLGNIMLGQVDSFYTLTITSNGQTYTSTTKIPSPKGIDSMWFAPPVFHNSKTPANALQMFVNYTDPDTPGNYVQYFTQRDGGLFYRSQIFSDELVNGKLVKNIALFAGFAATEHANGDSLSYFYPGEKVTLKWCEIDKNVYNFWNSLGYASNATGNPFASPINVQTNISNGGVGVWQGLGSTFTTLVVP